MTGTEQRSALDFLAGTGARRLIADSRRIRPGDAFAAYPGDEADGRRFIGQAIAAGAEAILWERHAFHWDAAWNVANLAIDGLRDQVGFIASAFHGEPSSQLWMVGVTGTNGKTSCAHWLTQCFGMLGKPAAFIGTVGNGFPDSLTPSPNTTPDAVTLHALLAEFKDRGASAVAMEVSSHGLDQGRVNGVQFDVALLTNLSRDHLDYHGDMAAYAAAKATLFDWPGLKYAVLNMDDPFGIELAGKLGCSGVKVAGYGFHGDSDGAQLALKGRNLSLGASGLRFEVATPWGKADIQSPLLGRFNASNLLGVLAVLLASDIPLTDAVAALSRIRAVPGRVQQLGGAGKPLVVVDYAHTPDALEKVLKTLREVMPGHGRLFCVFGCGGNRDKGKRPIMGSVAAGLSDRPIVTSDNPRHEEPRAIIDEIVAGMGANFHIQEDRAAAIAQAIGEAGPDDIVLVAGKGHEDYQDINGTKLPFSDTEVAQRTLQEYPAC